MTICAGNKKITTCINIFLIIYNILVELLDVAFSSYAFVDNTETISSQSNQFFFKEYQKKREFRSPSIWMSMFLWTRHGTGLLLQGCCHFTIIIIFVICVLECVCFIVFSLFLFFCVLFVCAFVVFVDLKSFSVFVLVVFRSFN